MTSNSASQFNVIVYTFIFAKHLLNFNTTRTHAQIHIYIYIYIDLIPANFSGEGGRCHVTYPVHKLFLRLAE